MSNLFQSMNHSPGENFLIIQRIKVLVIPSISSQTKIDIETDIQNLDMFVMETSWK